MIYTQEKIDELIQNEKIRDNLMLMDLDVLRLFYYADFLTSNARRIAGEVIAERQGLGEENRKTEAS